MVIFGCSNLKKNEANLSQTINLIRKETKWQNQALDRQMVQAPQVTQVEKVAEETIRLKNNHIASFIGLLTLFVCRRSNSNQFQIFYRLLFLKDKIYPK